MERLSEQYLFKPAINAGKMIFLSGPRQVGKTTLVQHRLEKAGNGHLYFNWEDPQVRREYTRNPHFLKPRLAAAAGKRPLVAFDEIHKHRHWKNILKGLYDIHRGEAQFIVTGSARLDWFRQSGDSLVGRYFSYRLLPLGLAEAAADFSHVLYDDKLLIGPDTTKLVKALQKVNRERFEPTLARLLTYGGFPEPFLRASRRFSTRWQRDYHSLLIQEDMRDLTRIQDLRGLEQLALILPEKIASPLSINSLREDLQVNHKTIVNWLEAFKKMYVVFSVKPWARNMVKAIRKEEKYYFYDWTVVNDPGARFENLTAVALLRLVSRFNELGLGAFELRYIRKRNGPEVDFLVVKDQRPYALFEAKTGLSEISRAGIHFGRVLQVPYYQLAGNNDVIEVFPGPLFQVPAWRLLALLG